MCNTDHYFLSSAFIMYCVFFLFCIMTQPLTKAGLKRCSMWACGEVFLFFYIYHISNQQAQGVNLRCSAYMWNITFICGIQMKIVCKHEQKPTRTKFLCYFWNNADINAPYNECCACKNTRKSQTNTQTQLTWCSSFALSVHCVGC